MLRAALDNVDSQVCAFLQFLNGPKFTGVQSDGERKDWISTGDVVHKLVDLRLACASWDVTPNVAETRPEIAGNSN